MLFSFGILLTWTNSPNEKEKAMFPRIKISLPSFGSIILPLILVLMFVASIFDPEQSVSSSPPPSAENESIEEIVRKAQSGDEASFNRLYQSYYTSIYRHLRRIVGHHEDACDLTVETFLKVWRGLSGLDSALKFRGWLFTIATHTALDFLRQKKVGATHLDCLDEDYIEQYAAKFEASVEERELVALALQQVSSKPRACLLLQLEGFSLSEISRIVGLGDKSAGMYVSIAREQFRKAYKRLEKL
jgi:RNA polymerase sigma-70 factor, ECF subfamily